MYPIELKAQPQKFIRNLPKDIQKQILDKIETLKDHPLPGNSEQLHENPQLQRIRTGRYRIIYHVEHEPKHIVITKIGDRKDVYRSM